MATSSGSARRRVAAKIATRSETRELFVCQSTTLRLRRRSGQWKSLNAGAVISLVFHTLLLSAMSLVLVRIHDHSALEILLSMTIRDTEPLLESVEVEQLVTDQPAPRTDLAESVDELRGVPAQRDIPEFPNPRFDQSPRRLVTGANQANSRLVSTRAEPVERRDEKAFAEVELLGPRSNQLAGRSVATRPGMVQQMGGNADSEAAVARGLEWLKKHQSPNGSWDFSKGTIRGCDCTMPGNVTSPTGATALALMAFLGAGKTHEEGEYQVEVRRALDYLRSKGTSARRGIHFFGPRSGIADMYSHGLATIALSEAYAMTGDQEIRPDVIGAVQFLMDTQKLDGGWRYEEDSPKLVSDTSVTAFQLMALKSAQFSRISVPQVVFNDVEKFLDHVSTQRGSQYSYLAGRPKPSQAMTAAALLCRMYLGWNEQNASLRAGIKRLDEWGPDSSNMYYNFYATQVMRHWGGPEWDKWNSVMRTRLVRTQIRSGHASGSWDPSDPYGGSGGRLYMTTFALLTLEVYYRHLPLYQQDRIEIPLIASPAETTGP